MLEGFFCLRFFNTFLSLSPLPLAGNSIKLEVNDIAHSYYIYFWIYWLLMRYMGRHFHDSPLSGLYIWTHRRIAFLLMAGVVT